MFFVSSCKKETVAPPTVKAFDGAITVYYTSADVSAEVTDQGGAEVKSRGFVYGLSGGSLDTIYCGDGIGVFSATLNNLQPNSNYVYEAFARNAGGIGSSGKVTFTTRDYMLPSVETYEVTDITTNSAICGGKVTNDGGGSVSERGICWGTSHNPTISGSHANSGTGTGEFTVNMTGLSLSTTYYVRAYAINSQGTAYGEEVNFTTNAVGMPTVTTANVTNIAMNTATCGGNVTNAGGGTVTARGVCWSTSSNPTISNSHTTNGTGTGSFTSSITGLSPNTTYYVRAYATNSAGTAYGNQRTFTTSAQVYLPTVTTNSVTNITQNSATCGGNVVNAGNGTVTARGVCWSTSSNPTINSNHTTNGTGTGSFTSGITNLSSGTTYYVRAYATNSAGTGYGETRTFTTASVPSVPTGAINGRFSVSASQRVYFSQGNLQYKASTAQWRFATNQYDYIGDANSNISQSYSGWIDLFGWGTSGWNCGNTYYRPWDSNNSNGSLYGPPGNYNLTGNYANSDWGYYNAISNGGNASHQWRTLTQGEWDYVFNIRNTSSGIRYAKAQVAGVNGVILLPDDWSTSYYNLYSTNSGGASFSSNVISSSTWENSLQSHGAVFLPAAGYRYGSSVYDVGGYGYYWSASYYGSYYAWGVNFDDGYLYADGADGRYLGRSVRLVCPAE